MRCLRLELSEEIAEVKECAGCETRPLGLLVLGWAGVGHSTPSRPRGRCARVRTETRGTSAMRCGAE